MRPFRTAAREDSTSNLQAGINWLADHFQVGQNFGAGQQWKYYYLYGLERAGRLAGVRFFGQNDWYRLGAEELVHEQNKLAGFWRGALGRVGAGAGDQLRAACSWPRAGRRSWSTSSRHPPAGDWNNDPDDVRNIVNIVSRDWKSLLTWQVVDPDIASVPELLQAPIVFFNGHHAPQFRPERQAEPPRIRRARGLHLRRGLLRQRRVRPGLRAC